MRSLRLVVTLTLPLAVAPFATLVARAQEGPTSASASSSGSATPDAVAAEAKRYFEQGETLRAAGQFLPAFEAYMKSRALLPRASNTLDAAVCLYNLGRFDEALELYEEALTKYPDSQLPPSTRESAKQTVAQIEPKVGRLDVSANVDGTLVIDGRVRGKLPLVAAVRVMPGKRVVRVLRDGFSTFEQAVDVKAGDTVRVDGKLEALTSAGRLKITEGTDLDGAALFVDGAPVGTLPWEGTLSPGTHVVQAIKGDVGTGPTLANVIVSQTVTLALVGTALAAEQRILVEPPTADLSIDGVAVGKGRWQGRLPMGSHVIEAREAGYFPGRLAVEIGKSAAEDIAVKLKVDESNPRWGVAKGRFAVAVFGGYGLAPGLGNDSTGWCVHASPCTQTKAPGGVRVGVEGLYELPSGIDIYVQAGYMSLTRGMTRSFASSFRSGSTTVPTTYDVNDDIRLAGPFAAAGIGYRFRLGETFDLTLRLGIGAAFLGSRDKSSGTGTGGGRTLATTTDGSGTSSDGLMFMTIPEIAAGVWLGGGFRATIGAAFPISLLTGPTLKLADTRASESSKNCAANAGAIDCAPGVRLDPDLAAFGRFVTIVPQASVGYWF